MRWLNMICLFEKGEQRRQKIKKMFALHPEHEYTTREVIITLRSWAGLVHSDLVMLHRQGFLHCRVNEIGTRLYCLNEATTETQQSACMPAGERWRPPPPRQGRRP